jgi:hypothetical protein
MSDLKKQITQMYNLAALKPVCERDLNGPEWQEYAEIQDTWDAQRDQEINSYRDEFDDRITKEVKRLIDEAGEFNLDHPPPFGSDNFDPNKIKNQADRNVRIDHEASLEGIELKRVNARQDLFDRSSNRQDQQGQAKDGFTRSAEPSRQPIRGGPS